MQEFVFWTICVFASVVCVLCDQTTDSDVDVSALMDRLLNSSDSRLRPNITGEPVDIYCGLFVTEFGPIDEVNMDFGMEIYFRNEWVDSRLNYSEPVTHVDIRSIHMSKIWLPDLYFPNERSGEIHDVISPNVFIKVFPGGRVLYSARLTLRLSCPMKLTHFPLDYQDCFLIISSYSYDETSMRLHWKSNDPIEVHDLSLPQFELLNWDLDTLSQKFTTGVFSTLKATFHMKRQVGFFVLQTYIPSILIVVLSWVSFWVSKDAVPARITLGVTTVLTMTTQLSTSRSNSMRVSYPKAIDVWYSFCMICVFGALLEFAVVNVLSRLEEKLSRRADCQNDITAIQGVITESPPHDDDDLPVDHIIEELEIADEVHEPSKDRNRRLLHNMERLTRKLRQYGLTHTRRVTAQGVDKCARIIFPAGFFLFNFVYWIFYTQPVVFGFTKFK